MLMSSRTELRANEAGARVFAELARLLYLQVCGELWPAHLALLRDGIASQLLSSYNHKSAVAQYIRRCSEFWRVFWENVDAVFLSRLAGMPLTSSGVASAPEVAVSGETEQLLALNELPGETERQLSIDEMEKKKIRR